MADASFKIKVGALVTDYKNHERRGEIVRLGEQGALLIRWTDRPDKEVWVKRDALMETNMAVDVVKGAPRSNQTYEPMHPVANMVDAYVKVKDGLMTPPNEVEEFDPKAYEPMVVPSEIKKNVKLFHVNAVKDEPTKKTIETAKEKVSVDMAQFEQFQAWQKQERIHTMKQLFGCGVCLIAIFSLWFIVSSGFVMGIDVGKQYPITFNTSRDIFVPLERACNFTVTPNIVQHTTKYAGQTVLQTGQTVLQTGQIVSGKVIDKMTDMSATVASYVNYPNTKSSSTGSVFGTVTGGTLMTMGFVAGCPVLAFGGGSIVMFEYMGYLW